MRHLGVPDERIAAQRSGGVSPEVLLDRIMNSPFDLEAEMRAAVRASFDAEFFGAGFNDFIPSP